MAGKVGGKGVLGLFEGFPVARAEEAAADGPRSVEHMYKPGEAVFGAVARDMVANGWSVFPQESGGNRRPGTVNGEMIKWSEHHRLATELPPPATLALWCAQCSPLNVAVVLGAASGHAFVVDIDVTEVELSAQIQELADSILGRTPFRRVGRWPKMALIYRHAAEDEVPSRSPKFSAHDDGGNVRGGDQGLEIISAGKAMTFHGKHHVTGRYFTWLEASPLTLGPDAAPLVSSSQVSDFMDAVDSVRQFHKSASLDSTLTTWEWDENQKIHVPRVRSAGAASDWVEDENGKVVDGREAFLSKLVVRLVTANAGAATSGPDGIAMLTRIAIDQFSANAELSGRWKGRALERETLSKVRHAAEGVRSGRLSARSPHRDEKGEYVVAGSVLNHLPAQPRDPAGDSLDFLPPFVDTAAPLRQDARQPMRFQVVAPAPGAAAERAISSDRRPVAQAVAGGLLDSFNAFFDEVYDPERLETRVTILKAPTGAGKTSRSIAFIAEDPRTKEPFEIRDLSGLVTHSGRSPIVYLLPTYANIEELRHRAKVLNLDPGLADAALRAQASEMGLIHEDDLPARVEELRRDAKNAGLTTMLYQGKLRAGCQMADKVKLAMEAGVGTSGLCKAIVDTGKKDKDGGAIKEEKFCPHYVGCPAIEQRNEIERCHVVFMPHAFLALNIPEELRKVRCVVADERIHHLFLHTAEFDMSLLSVPRKAPRLSKKEKDAGLIPADFVEERRSAAHIVSRALVLMTDDPTRCPVEELYKEHQRVPMAKRKPLDLVDSALRVCSSALQRDGTITPDMTFDELQDLCSQPTGQAVREEHRFWSIIHERLTARLEEGVVASLASGAGADAPGRKTTGPKELRIQTVEDVGPKGEVKHSVRISWRSDPNWLDRPLLLLDASAAPEMIRKIWKGKEVVISDIPASLNVRVVAVADRTYSNASVIAPPSATQQEKVSSGKLLNRIRRAISMISGSYGWSRTVAGGSILVRKAVNTSWAGPDNVDWCHFGAMRGLDFAKFHEAAISVGRMELPVRTIDGLVAALTYDDPEPEMPFDARGNGLAADGMPLRIPMGVQRVRMRSGHDLETAVPMFPGKWGRMIQKQYREEELLQFLGRLRPVYREGAAPIWFSLTSVIPEEVVVDDVITLDDLLKSEVRGRGRRELHVFEALRRSGGVLDPELSHVLCDDLYPSRKAAATEMDLAGLDPQTGEASGRLGWGLATVRWTDRSGARRHSFVRADLPDAAAALRNAAVLWLGEDPVDAKVVRQARRRTLAKGRTPDKIENELGTLPERRDAERSTGDRVAVRVMMETPPQAFAHQADRREQALPVTVPVAAAADARGRPAIVTLSDLEAQEAINQLWRKLGREAPPKPADLGLGAALNAAAPGAPDERPDYGDAGAHVTDRAPEPAAEHDPIDDLIPY